MVTSFITIFGRCASINRFASLLPLFKNYTADTSVKEVDSSDLIATTLSLSSQPTSLTSPTLSNSSSLSGTAYNLFRVFALTTPMNPWVTRKSIVPITFHHSHVVPPSTHFIWDIYRLGLFRKWYHPPPLFSANAQTFRDRGLNFWCDPGDFWISTAEPRYMGLSVPHSKYWCYSYDIAA